MLAHVGERHNRIQAKLHQAHRDLRRAESVIQALNETNQHTQQEYLTARGEIHRLQDSLDQAMEIIGQDSEDIDTFHRVYTRMRLKHGSNMLNANDIHQIEEVERRLDLDKERWMP